jgi:hypothetical protein
MDFWASEQIPERRHGGRGHEPLQDAPRTGMT